MMLVRIAAAIAVAFGAPQGIAPRRHATTLSKHNDQAAIEAARAKRERRQQKRRSQQQ